MGPGTKTRIGHLYVNDRTMKTMVSKLVTSIIFQKNCFQSKNYAGLKKNFKSFNFLDAIASQDSVSSLSPSQTLLKY